MTTAPDAYRAKLHATIASLRYWVPQLRAQADIEDEETEQFWRLAARPHVANACPFELILHADGHFDIGVGSQSFEGGTVGTLDDVLPILAAIADGRIVQHVALSRNTGARRSIETLVTLADGRQWRDSHIDERMAAAIPVEDCVLHTRHFVPYLRD